MTMAASLQGSEAPAKESDKCFEIPSGRTPLEMIYLEVVHTCITTSCTFLFQQVIFRSVSRDWSVFKEVCIHYCGKNIDVD